MAPRSRPSEAYESGKKAMNGRTITEGAKRHTSHPHGRDHPQVGLRKNGRDYTVLSSSLPPRDRTGECDIVLTSWIRVSKLEA